MQSEARTKNATESQMNNSWSIRRQQCNDEGAGYRPWLSFSGSDSLCADMKEVDRLCNKLIRGTAHDRGRHFVMQGNVGKHVQSTGSGLIASFLRFFSCAVRRIARITCEWY